MCVRHSFSLYLGEYKYVSYICHPRPSQLYNINGTGIQNSIDFDRIQTRRKDSNETSEWEFTSMGIPPTLGNVGVKGRGEYFMM